MPNYNLRIALTKLKGARVMEIEGKTRTRLCVVIPIDYDEGTVQDSYKSKIDGLPTTKPLNDVQLNLTAFEFTEMRYGHSHGIKASFSKERFERMTEEELRSMPIIGNMNPWSVKKDDDDLPPANAPREDEW